MGRDLQAGVKGGKTGEDRVWAKCDDVDCDSGRENADKGTSVREILRENPGNGIPG